MNKKNAALLVLICLISSVQALEITGSVSAGNNQFDPTARSSLSSVGKPFPGNWDFGMQLGLSDKINKQIPFSVTFNREPILGNTLTCTAGMELGAIKFSGGLFWSLWNSLSEPATPGLLASIMYTKPGIFFIDAEAGSSLSAGIGQPGASCQSFLDLSSGFWTSFAVISARIETVSSSLKQTYLLTTTDTKTRYEGIIDIYKKNVPYTIKVLAGYQHLSRLYSTPTSLETDSLGAIVSGAKVTMQFTRDFQVFCGIDSLFFAWGSGGMGNPLPNTPLLSTQAGVKIFYK